MSLPMWTLWLPAVASWTIILLLRFSPLSRPLADLPNERSLHEQPTPRIGGIGVMVTSIACMALVDDHAIRAIAGAAAALALVSLADDVRSLPIQVRLPAHAVAALAAVLAFGSPSAGTDSWGWMESAASLFAIVWMTNLFNFMDGSDGLAGGMASIGFAALAIAAYCAGAVAIAIPCAVLASAAVGFLAHNFPPAKVFLGDAGSVPLGFLAGALGAYGVRNGTWPAWFPILVFSPFIVDATVTILRRLARGERIWIAHRSHYYQRLVLSGWSRAQLALAAYSLMAAAAGAALAALGSGELGRYAIIFVSAALYALLLVAIDRQASPSRR